MMPSRTFSHWAKLFSLALLVFLLLANTSVSVAQILDPAEQAREDLQQLADEIGQVDQHSLRASLVASADDPQLAQWYQGKVQQEGQWLTLQQIEKAAAKDKRWSKYIELRNQANHSLRDHERLARWCHKNKLVEHENMHWLYVLQFNNSHRAALKALDLVWHDGLLMTTDEASAYKQRQLDRNRQMRDWRAKIKRLRIEAELPDLLVRQAAREQLNEIREPEAVPALIEQFAEPIENEALTVDRGTQLMSILGGIDSPQAVDSLVQVAIDSDNRAIRYAAVEQLETKPLAEFVPALLAEMAMPIEASVNINAIGNRVVSDYSYSQEQVGGNELTRTSQSSELVRGRRYYAVPLHRYQKVSDARVITGRTAMVPIIPGHGRSIQAIARSSCSSGGGTAGYVRPYDPKYLKEVALPDLKVPARYKAEYAGTAYFEDPEYAQRQERARQKLVAEAKRAEAAWVERNQNIEQRNERIAEVLTDVTGKRLSAFPKSWWNWWGNYLEQNPDVGTVGTRQQLNFALLNQQQRGLARGTWVWTREGKKPIETVRPGDYVLAQNPDTGELTHKVVLALATPQQMPVSRVAIDASELHCAASHVIWAVGAGWQRVSKLAAGQSLHGALDSFVVASVKETFSIDSYDLIVDDFHTFFVGEQGLLVHDATPIGPAPVALPGFSPAAVADAVDLAAK